MTSAHFRILSETESDPAHDEDTNARISREYEQLEFRNKVTAYIRLGLISAGWNKYTTRVHIDDDDEVTVHFDDSLSIETLAAVQSYLADPILSGRTVTGILRPTVINDVSRWSPPRNLRF